jgi:hypothetical protein
MQPTRMAFVAVGTTLAFVAALVWGGAYFASAGPSASELPHASVSLPLVTPVQSPADLSTDTDFATHTAQVPTDASAGTTTTATDTTLISVAQNGAATAPGDQSSSRTNTTTAPAAIPPWTLTTLVATSTPPRTTVTTRSTATTRVATATTTATVRVASNTTLPYFQTSLPLGDDESTGREVVRPKLPEDRDD